MTTDVDERAVLDIVEFSESEDEDFDYKAVEDAFLEEESEEDEDLSAALASLRMHQEGKAKGGPRQQGVDKVSTGAEAVGDEPSRGTIITQVRPSVVDDFIRNFLIKVRMLRTLDSFNTEWYELQAKGRLGEEYTTNVPDIYLRNEELDGQVVALRQELTKMQAITDRAQGTWDKFRKERDFHRMHHRRVVQEKARMAMDLKRLKQHFKAYEPTLKELERKYKLAMKEKMLMKLERDRIKAKTEAIEAHMKAFQKERGVTYQEEKSPLIARAMRRPAQSADGVLFPIAVVQKNPQPTMGGRHKRDSKLPTDDDVSGIKVQRSMAKISNKLKIHNPFMELIFQPPPVERFALRKSFKGHLNSVSAVAFHPRKKPLIRRDKEDILSNGRSLENMGLARERWCWTGR